jgi:hypothetical protein
MVQVGFCLEMVYDTLYGGEKIQTEFTWDRWGLGWWITCGKLFYLNG